MKTYTQEEVDALMEQISDLEACKQELVYRASPIPINSKVINPIDGEEWTVIDVDFDFGKFVFTLEQPGNPENGIRMLSESNVKMVSDPLRGKIINMKLDDSKISVRLKE